MPIQNFPQYVVRKFPSLFELDSHLLLQFILLQSQHDCIQSSYAFCTLPDKKNVEKL